ncbi:Hypothetical predicted protein [Mytilus galloprovincialis]|uniref:Uncharacterized protein n=1 Tax=Mytilus galloprovincialis TaxID=29158 RepID=A0A8B6DF10_MYTGA|nr:Hypothetical predicted protein [Mytilus galloprovincialis]
MIERECICSRARRMLRKKPKEDWKREQKGQVVLKKYHGNISNYTLNKDEFLVEIKSLMEEGIKSGILLVHTDEYYDTLTEDKIRQRLQLLGEETSVSCQDMRFKLKNIERTFKLKMWHDHSDILNHSFVNFMTTIMYDAANFMTDNEYQTLARTTSSTTGQSIVEKPQL